MITKEEDRDGVNAEDRAVAYYRIGELVELLKAFKTLPLGKGKPNRQQDYYKFADEARDVFHYREDLARDVAALARIEWKGKVKERFPGAPGQQMVKSYVSVGELWEGHLIAHLKEKLGDDAAVKQALEENWRSRKNELLGMSPEDDENAAELAAALHRKGELEELLEAFETLPQGKSKPDQRYKYYNFEDDAQDVFHYCGDVARKVAALARNEWKGQFKVRFPESGGWKKFKSYVTVGEAWEEHWITYLKKKFGNAAVEQALKDHKYTTTDGVKKDDVAAAEIALVAAAAHGEGSGSSGDAMDVDDDGNDSIEDRKSDEGDGSASDEAFLERSAFDRGSGSGNSAGVTPQQPPAAAAPAPLAAVTNEAERAEAEEAALLAQLAGCGALLRVVASAGDPVAAVTALGALEALGNAEQVEKCVSSYEGLVATGVVQALQKLTKQKTYGRADATHAIQQATRLVERWKAEDEAIRDRSKADSAKAKRLMKGVEGLIAPEPRIPKSFRRPPPDVTCCAEIKLLRCVRAESSPRPPRHRRGASSTAWPCGSLTTRFSQHSHVVAEK